MNHWPFIFAAYFLTVMGTAFLLLVSWTSMRRAEAEAEKLRGK